MKKNFMLTLMALFVFFTMVLSVSSISAADKEIKIGTFLSITGPASFLGDPELKTLQMYIEEINKKGGVNGNKLALYHYDDGGKSQDATEAVKKLIKKDRVDVILGGTTSGTSIAVIDIVEQEQIPFISMAGSIQIVDPVKKWVFKTPHTDKMAVEKIFEDMKKRGFTKIALISGDGGFDKSGHAQCVALAPKYGITLVSDEFYGNSDTDMTAQLTKIRSADAQAILNFGFGKAPAIVTKNIRQLDIKLPLYQSHGVASKDFLKLAGDAANGIRLPAAPLIVAEQLKDSDPLKKPLLDYKTKYEAKHGEISTFGGHAYDALMIAVKAIEKTKSVDKAKIRDEIEQIKDFPGTAGMFNMSATDHMGLALSSFKMVEVVNGNWKIVE